MERYRLDVPLYNVVEDPHGYWIDRDDYEAVVRELAAAREKLESVTVVKDGMIRVAKELSDEVERLRALLDELRIAVMEMHHDNVKGDFELPPLARIDLDACVAKCSDARIPRAGETK